MSLLDTSSVSGTMLVAGNRAANMIKSLPSYRWYSSGERQMLNKEISNIILARGKCLWEPLGMGGVQGHGRPLWGDGIWADCSLINRRQLGQPVDSTHTFNVSLLESQARWYSEFKGFQRWSREKKCVAVAHKEVIRVVFFDRLNAKVSPSQQETFQRQWWGDTTH